MKKMKNVQKPYPNAVVMTLIIVFKVQFCLLGYNQFILIYEEFIKNINTFYNFRVITV